MDLPKMIQNSGLVHRTRRKSQRMKGLKNHKERLVVSGCIKLPVRSSVVRTGFWSLLSLGNVISFSLSFVLIILLD